MIRSILYILTYQIPQHLAKMRNPDIRDNATVFFADSCEILLFSPNLGLVRTNTAIMGRIITRSIFKYFSSRDNASKAPI